METPADRIRQTIQEEITIQSYNRAWPELFECERQHLLRCLPIELVERIEHFGSTAVPGLASKPVVDMLIGVTSLAATRRQIVPVLTGQGYDYFWRPTYGDHGGPWYAWFIKRDPTTRKRTHHLHMVESTFTEHWDRLLFRDYLIGHPQTAAEYASLKGAQAARHANDRVRYAQKKTEFIVRVTELAKSLSRSSE